jgi:hypothetical protein
MTLSGSLKNVDPHLRLDLKTAAQAWFAPLLQDGIAIDAVTWFSQDHPKGNFRWVDRFELGTSH